MPYFPLITICVTVLIAAVTLMAQAMNAFVKVAAITELKLRVDRLEQHYSDVVVMKRDIEYIKTSLEEIKGKIH